MASLLHVVRNGFHKYIFSKYTARSRRCISKMGYCKDLTYEENGTEELSSPEVENIKEKMKISVGKYANFSDGSAVVELEGTAVMATAVGVGCPDYKIPLTVHYQQKSSAIGRIPTNYFRRELGQSDSEILVSRLVDRSLRPLFSSNSAIETQIICSPLAMDGKNFPDVLAINAASAALACSDIPWNGPVGAVRIGVIDSEPVINPSKSELVDSSVNLILTAMKGNLVVMVEGSCQNVGVMDLQRYIKIGLKHCKQIVNQIESIRASCGKNKRDIDIFNISSDIEENYSVYIQDKLREIFLNHSYMKTERDKLINDVYKDIEKKILDEHPDLESSHIGHYFYSLQKSVYRSVIFETERRCDGRLINELRPITCESSLYESLHGSSSFQRGQTQVFCTVSLDSPSSSLKLDNISYFTSGVKEKKFFVHYQFPPFATGEIGKIMKPRRREVGHGTLAENSLKCAIPSLFPFTIRLNADVFESNGSSSMATVCGGTAALLDAGIPLEHKVVGVAMGLLTKVVNGKIEDYRILTDLMGMEDYLGDMDFKIAGTKSGITGLQLDVKIPGLPIKIFHHAISEAKKVFPEILKIVNDSISGPREEAKSNWPVMKIITIPPHNRAKFIGFGGSNIKRLEIEIGVEIIELGDGKYSIFAVNQCAMDEALESIENTLATKKEPELEFGGVYTATVTEITDSGVFVILFPEMSPTLIRLSQLDVRKVHHPKALGLDVGSQFPVKYFGRDPVTGTMRLSKRALTFRDEPIARSYVKKSEN